MQLPDGLTARPLTPDDAHAVHALMVAQEVADVGEAGIEGADIVGDWQRPSFDVTASSLGVFDGPRLVAYAELISPERADAAVHPAYRGRGLGTALAGWLRDLGRRRGDRVVGSPVPLGSPGDRLLERLGYHERWRSWVLRLPPGSAVPTRPLATGHVLRTAESEADRRAAYVVREDAFLEWSVRGRESYEDWSATSILRPGFASWNLRVAVEEATGDVVGMCLVLLAEHTGYVDQLAVRRDRRGLGLGQALLADAFALAREYGATSSELATDSRTGALGLYEKVGMEVVTEWVHRAIEL